MDTTPTARAIALRHKLETPRNSDPSDHEKYEEMLGRIFEVYGLAQPGPEKNRSQVAAATEGGEPMRSSSNRPARGEGAHGKPREPGEDARPKSSGPAPQDSTGPPGE
ncbi:MAG: hypothetical protein ACRD3O_02845 [Terriglobia bacterium]